MNTGSLTKEEYDRVMRAVSAADDLRSGTPEGRERFERWRVATFGPHRYGPGRYSVRDIVDINDCLCTEPT